MMLAVLLARSVKLEHEQSAFRPALGPLGEAIEEEAEPLSKAETGWNLGGEGTLECPLQRGDQRIDDLLLAPEIGVERGRRVAGFLGDIVNGDTVEALARKGAPRSMEDVFSNAFDFVLKAGRATNGSGNRARSFAHDDSQLDYFGSLRSV
jgi:hypothetical protein